MKVVDAEFVISAVSEKQYPKDDLPEFALAVLMLVNLV